MPTCATKSRLDTIKKAPNSISCKMENCFKEKGKQMFGFYFCFLSIEVFGIADFQGHFFSYTSNFFHWGSKWTLLVFFALCLCEVLLFVLTVQVILLITRLIVCCMAFSGTTQNLKYSSVRHTWCEDSLKYTLLGIKCKFPWKELVFVVFICLYNLG